LLTGHERLLEAQRLDAVCKFWGWEARVRFENILGDRPNRNYAETVFSARMHQRASVNSDANGSADFFFS
jgi:hypothetical protein